MAQPTLTTVPKVKAWLSDPIDAKREIIIQDYVTTASRMIRQVTGRRFTSPRVTSVTREFPTYETDTVYVDEVFAASDIITVTDEHDLALPYEIDWDEDGGIVKGAEITVTPLGGSGDYGLLGLPADHSDLFITELNAYAIRRHAKRIKVTGNFGYAAIPEDVEFAARRTVGVWFKEEVSRYTADAFISRGQVFEPDALPSIALSQLRGAGWVIEEPVMV